MDYNATTPVIDSTGSYLFVPRNTSSAGTGGEIASYVISSYQVNKANQRLQRYTIDPSSGALTLQPDFTPVSAGDHILVVDPSGKYAYVTSAGSATVSSYSIDATTGALTLVSTLAAGSGAFIPQTVGLQ